MRKYLETSQALSRLLTCRYSTSFSLGTKVFPPAVKRAVFSVYGFVRVADEIVDTFPIPLREKLLEEFKRDIYQAVERKISVNPVLHAFQDTVNAYDIPSEYINAFLESMAMDLDRRRHSRESYEKYIYGSAEVIGLMCLKIFCGKDSELFKFLEPYACKLGSAFQKVNFLRDIKSDLDGRGRIYVPDINTKEDLTDAVKKNMENEIREEFRKSLPGIKRLPRACRLATYSAFLYYQALFDRLQKADMETILAGRIRVPNIIKFFLLIKAFFVINFLWKR